MHKKTSAGDRKPSRIIEHTARARPLARSRGLAISWPTARMAPHALHCIARVGRARACNRCFWGGGGWRWTNLLAHCEESSQVLVWGPRRTARGPRAHIASHLPCVCRLAAPLPSFQQPPLCPVHSTACGCGEYTGLGGCTWGLWRCMHERGPMFRRALLAQGREGRVRKKCTKNEKWLDLVIGVRAKDSDADKCRPAY